MAESVLFTAAFYGLMGLIFGTFFVLRGVHRVDAAAAGAPWGFRLLILPGSAALWPLTLNWWLRAAKRTKMK